MKHKFAGINSNDLVATTITEKMFHDFLPQVLRERKPFKNKVSITKMLKKQNYLRKPIYNNKKRNPNRSLMYQRK
jgi:hypothetical protein